MRLARGKRVAVLLASWMRLRERTAGVERPGFWGVMQLLQMISSLCLFYFSLCRCVCVRSILLDCAVGRFLDYQPRLKRVSSLSCLSSMSPRFTVTDRLTQGSLYSDQSLSAEAYASLQMSGGIECHFD